MITLKRLILEGKYDSLVTKLSNKCIALIKDSSAALQDPNGEFAGKKIYNNSADVAEESFPHIYFEEIENLDIPLEFYFILKVKWDDSIDGFNYGGDAYNETGKTAADPPLIEVRIEINPTAYPKVLSRISMALRDVIRHEVEHTTQSGLNLKQGKYLRSDMSMRNKIASGDKRPAEYFLLKKEIPAMIQGMYMKAKKMKRPFKDVVHDYLSYYVQDGYISDKEYEKIIKTWRTYLPKLGIRQEL
jgi:hypothetical protein